MADWKELPLGIDLGSTRARIALAECDRNENVRIRAIVARDLPDGAATPLCVMEPDLVSAVIEDMVSELGSRERRCVLALGAPACALRVIAFPKMTWAERMRAARFEAQRFSGWTLDTEETVVRVHAVDPTSGEFAVGVTRRQAIETRVESVKKAGLRVVAVDHEAFALRRLFPQCDAIVDVAAERSGIHIFGEHGPLSLAIELGGAAITQGIAAELSIDLPSAERRKRILGCAGAGLGPRTELIEAIASVVERARARGPIERIALTGNGSRIPTFARELEEAVGSVTEMPVPELLRTGVYPEDVVRAASPDWVLAASLAVWALAA